MSASADDDEDDDAPPTNASRQSIGRASRMSRKSTRASRKSKRHKSIELDPDAPPMHDPTDHGRVRSEPEDLAIPDPRGLQSHGLGEVRVGIEVHRRPMHGNDLPRLDPDERIEAGDVVGIFNGKVTKRTEGAHRVMVVSSAPADRANSSFSAVLAAAITLAPIALPISTAVMPTPPAAPSTSPAGSCAEAAGSGSPSAFAAPTAATSVRRRLTSTSAFAYRPD